VIEGRVRRVLDASTEHLPRQIAAQLPSWPGVIAYPLSTSDEHFGWLLWVPDDPEARAAEYPDDPDSEDSQDGVPAEVLTLWRYARSLGCDYVLLDRDAERIDGLPTWDW
jgi:hypothetical protein